MAEVICLPPMDFLGDLDLSVNQSPGLVASSSWGPQKSSRISVLSEEQDARAESLQVFLELSLPLSGIFAAISHVFGGDNYPVWVRHFLIKESPYQV